MPCTVFFRGAAALSLALLTACAPAAEAPTAETEVAVSLPRLEPIATFGCAECEGPEMLANPQVVMGPSGRAYLLETTEPLVRVLEPGGSFAFATGQVGEGPGEIRAPILVAVLEVPDGSFWVVGPAFMHHRAPDGTHLASELYSTRIPIGIAVDHTAGALYQVGFPAPVPENEGLPRRALLRFEPGAGEPQSVAPWEELIGESAEEAAELHARWSTIAVAPDGAIAIVDIRNYRVRVLDPDGSLRLEFGRPGLDPIPKDSERLERERQRAAERNGPAPDPYEPQVGPRAAFDGQGRLWLPVRRDLGLVDVFDPDGTLLGEVDLGAELFSTLPSLSIAGDLLGAALYDANGLAVVRTWRIVDDD